MSLIVIPNTFVASTTAIASQVNANFAAVTAVVNGGLDQTNFGPLSGVVTWSISSNVLALNISSSSTAGALASTYTGVLAAGKSIYSFVSGANQTTGDAGASFEFTSASSTIPVVLVQNAGSGVGISSIGTGSGAAIRGEQSSAASAIEGLNSGSGPALRGDNSSTGNALELGDGTNTTFAINGLGSIVKWVDAPNIALNGAMDAWTTAPPVSGPDKGYGPVNWYVNAYTGSIVSFDQTTGELDGSVYGCEATIASGGSTGSTELIYILGSGDYVNKTMSCGVQIKARNNVTQVGIQFLYATSETKLTGTIGTEKLVSVNSSTFTRCKLEGVALGSSMTTYGVIGVRIRVTAVSGGHLYDVGQGFVAEQLQINEGQTTGTWRRRHATYAEEFDATTQYYQLIGAGQLILNYNGATGVGGGVTYPRMRAAPTVLLVGAPAFAILGIGSDTLYSLVASNVCPTGFSWAGGCGNSHAAGTIGILTTADCISLDAQI